MQDHEFILRDYFGAADDSFWRWEQAGDAVGWRDGKLIAFNEEITYVLKHLAPTGLPRFGALLLLMAATRKNWAVDNSEAGVLSGMVSAVADEDPESSGQLRMAMLQRVLAGLHKVRALDGSLRTSLEAKAAIAAMVFDGRPPAVVVPLSYAVADAIRPGLLTIVASTNDSVSSGYGPILLLRDLADLAAGLDRVTPEAVRLRMETGLDELPLPAPLEEEEEEQPVPSDSARAIIQQLLDTPEHAGMAKLAKQLLASTTLPRKLSESQEHEMGGYSDIANRGTPDRLLLSELAQDGLTLAVRVAMNEAMYLHRETPPSIPKLRRELLIDSGVRAWGVQRVFATSVALALAGNTPPGASFAAWRGSGEQLVEVDLCSKEGVIDHLAALEPDPHLADALPRFAAQIEDSRDPVEAIVLMPADALAEPAMKESLRQLAAERVYVATVDRDGQFRLVQRHLRGEKMLRQAKLSLEGLMSDTTTLKESREFDQLPAIFRAEPFPLRLPAQVESDSSWSIGNWGALSITGDGRLLRWTDPKRGAEQLSDQLPKGKLWWASPDCVQGATSFVYGAAQKLVLYHLDIPRGDVQRTPIQCQIATGVTFHNGVLFCLQPFGVTEVNPATGETGSQLTMPSRLHWAGGRYFVDRSTNTWMALSHNGHNATIDPLTTFSNTKEPVVQVWDALGFSEPIALTINGTLLAAEADLSKVPTNIPRLTSCTVVAASHDGTRLLIVAERSGYQSQYLLSLSTEPKFEARRATIFDERVAAVARPTTVRKRFRSIGITTDGTLALRASKSVVAFQSQVGMPVLRQFSRMNRFVAEQEFKEADTDTDSRFRLSTATWPSGDRAVLDSRGLLHLQPANPETPEVTLVLAEGELTGWSDRGEFFGKDYFLPEDKQSTKRAFPARKIYQETIAKFTEAVRANS